MVVEDIRIERIALTNKEQADHSAAASMCCLKFFWKSTIDFLIMGSAEVVRIFWSDIDKQVSIHVLKFSTVFWCDWSKKKTVSWGQELSVILSIDYLQNFSLIHNNSPILSNILQLLQSTMGTISHNASNLFCSLRPQLYFIFGTQKRLSKIYFQLWENSMTFEKNKVRTNTFLIKHARVLTFIQLDD